MPCTDDQGVPCLYDFVTKMPFYNKGTGSFVVGNVVRDFVQVSGLPANLTIDGEPVYGVNEATKGQEFTFAAPEGQIVHPTGTVVRCTGWKIYDWETKGLICESDENNKFLCSLTYERPVNLVWQWEVRYRVTVSADEGLTASASAQWVEHGDSVTLTATSAGDKDFVRWTGDVTGVDALSPTFTTTVTGPMTLAAKTPAAVYYVAPNGKGKGSSWADAFGSIQDAVTAAGTAADGAIVYLKAGNYFQTAAVTATGVGPLTIRGGYTGKGLATGGTTVVARENGAAQCNLFSFSGSTVTLDSLVISNGYTASVSYGQGVALMNACTASLVNCRFLDNGNGNVDADSDHFGGAVGIQNGKIRIVDCEFARNTYHDSGSNVKPLGGAVGMTGDANSSILIRNCSFSKNWTRSVHARASGGGAIGFRNVPSVRVENCTFDGNYARTWSDGNDLHGGGQPGPYGGVAHFSGVARAEFSDCLFRTNWLAEGRLGVFVGNGGLIYLTGSTLVMNRCASYMAGYSGYASNTYVGNYSCGDISVRGGSSLYMTNVLLGATYNGYAIVNDGGRVEAVNCTIAGTKGFTTYRTSHAYVQNSGSASFRNCILWNNHDGDMNISSGDEPVFEYCVTQSAHAGPGNTTDDPLFGDEVYFHLQSKAGRYDGGWFDGGSWVTTDEATSAAIDAGNPFIPYADEPQPNLSRVNIGYDGGTETASKSVCGTDPVVKDDELMIFAYAATGEGAEGATVSAHVASTGGAENPNVKVVWGDSDKGTNSVSYWGANVADLGVREPWALVEYRIAGITGYNTVWYRFVAENAKGVVVWSDPVRSFKIAKPPTIAYADDADVVTHLYRTGARIHANLADNGGVDTIVRLIYWPVADYSAPVTVVVNDGLACPLGPVTIATDELTPGTEYAYVIEAENSVKVVRLAEKRFTTVADAAKLTLVGGPANVGHGDGATFDHPSGELQMLLDALYRPGDELLLMEGTNIVADTLLVSNHEGLLIKGGYTAGGETREGVSMIRRNSALPKPHRVFTVTASKIGFDQVTVSEGQYNEGGGDCYGMGVALLSGCNAAFTNCVFRNNGCNDTNEKTTYGAAIGAQNGTLEIVDCVFTNNSVKGGGNNVRPCGGAVGATGARVRITGSTFTRNWVQHIHARYWGGGALGFRGCPSVEIDHCTFLTNWSYSGGSGNNSYYTPQKDHGPYGGTIYFGNATAATIADCTFRGGWNASYNSDTPTWGWGGVLCVADRAKVALVRTKFLGTGACDSWYTAKPHFCSGSIDVKDSGSALYMTNVLHAGAVRGPCLGNNGGTIDAVNCTFAGAIGEGSQPSAAYVQYGSEGVTTFRNCIVWGNKGGYLYEGNGGTPTATYCDLQGTDPDAEKGIISADPRFRNPSVYDYSLRSRSPCGNAGDKTGIPRTEKDIDGNPRYKGKIDMGCYESRGDPFCIRIY